MKILDSDKLRASASERDNFERDLELTPSSLLEKEQDYADLLEQFLCHEENATSNVVEKPNGVIFYDEITEPCVSKLKATIAWNKVKKNLGDIDESDNIKNIDLAVILTGASEISFGVSAFHLHQTLKRILSDCCGQTQDIYS